MTKAQLIANVAAATNQTRQQVEITLNAIIWEIKESVSEGATIYLREFGSFEPKHFKARKARNIKRNTEVFVPAKIIPAFKPSSIFIEQVKKALRFPIN